MSNIRAIARQLDPRATVDNIATMDEIVSNSIARPRLYAMLLATFAGIAVTLAGIGIYGVMSFSVAQRRREIGIRIALGARHAAVMGLVLRRGAMLTGLGLAAGLAGAAALTGSLRGFLFGITPLDSATFVAVTVLFAAIALLAAYVPARKATAVDPLAAIRSE